MRDKLQMIFAIIAFAAASMVLGPSSPAQTPWFTASVTKGISPLTTTLTWTCPAGSVTATASSSNSQSIWNGTKPLSGSQVLSGIRADTSYKLDCATAASATVSATLTWKLPTLNTDNSPYTNNAGARVSWGTSAGDVSANFDAHSVKIADPTATSYTFASVPAGTLYYAVRAYNTDGLESALSNIASKTGAGTPGQTFSASVTITVQTQPMPPVLSTVDTVAYEIVKNTDAIKLAAIGTVPMGVACQPQYDANGMHVVPRDRVKFKGIVRPLVVVAKCG
jgi:hypothetical protein